MIKIFNKTQIEAVIEAIPLMAWVSQADGTIVYYNKKWRNFVGFSYESMENLDWQKYHHPDDLEKTKALVIQTFNSGIECEYEYRLKSSLGEYRWHFMKVVPVKDDDNIIAFWIATAFDIHNQKIYKEELERQVQERTIEESNKILDSIPQIAWMTTVDGKNSYSNKSWQNYTGISFEDSKGDGWSSVFHPDDMKKLWVIRKRCFEIGEGMEIECRIRRVSDGMYRWHLAKALPYRDSCGKIVKWIGVSTDIHDQKMVAEKTSQGEAFLKEAQEIAHMGSWELNLDTYHIFWSDELYRIFGYEPGKTELTYQTFLSSLHPEDLQKVLDSNVIIKANRKPLKITYRIIRPDNKIRYISSSLKAIVDNEDNMIVIRGTCQDVTELKESQRFIQEISNASPGIIAVYDLNMKSIIYANREINIALGYSNEEKSEMGSSTYEKIIHPDDQPMFFKFLENSLSFTDEETGEIECRMRHARGEWIWFRIRMKVFKRDINEKVFQIIGIAQDVTYRRKLEEEAISLKLSKHKEILNAILHAQEGERERIGEALHNGLGQLLYAVKLNLETYIAKSGTDLKKDKLMMNDITCMLGEAIDETRKISFELMPGILKYFGLEISLKELGKKICRDFNVKWTIVGLNDRLGDYIEIAIFRIIQELMNNIVKHAKVNEAKIELIKKGSIINIHVEDNGVGFDMEKLDSIRKGTGLQSIRNRAKLLNGKIDIVSKPGKGTAISIQIDESQYMQ